MDVLLPNEIIGTILAYNEDYYLNNLYVSKSIFAFLLQFGKPSVTQTNNVFRSLISSSNLNKLRLFLQYHPKISPWLMYPVTAKMVKVKPIKAANHSACLQQLCKYGKREESGISIAIRSGRGEAFNIMCQGTIADQGDAIIYQQLKKCESLCRNYALGEGEKEMIVLYLEPIKSPNIFQYTNETLIIASLLFFGKETRIYQIVSSKFMSRS